MTVATSGGQQAGALERIGGGGLADVVETVLDKGIVIDAQVSVDVVGIQLMEINARIAIASIETYLRFAETVDRLDVVPEGQQGLVDLVEDVSGAITKGTAVGGLGRAAKEISGAVVDSPGDRGSGDRDQRRRRDGERRDE